MQTVAGHQFFDLLSGKECLWCSACYEKAPCLLLFVPAVCGRLCLVKFNRSSINSVAFYDPDNRFLAMHTADALMMRPGGIHGFRAGTDDRAMYFFEPMMREISDWITRLQA